MAARSGGCSSGITDKVLPGFHFYCFQNADELRVTNSSLVHRRQSGDNFLDLVGVGEDKLSLQIFACASLLIGFSTLVPSPDRAYMNLQSCINGADLKLFLMPWSCGAANSAKRQDMSM